MILVSIKHVLFVHVNYMSNIYIVLRYVSGTGSGVGTYILKLLEDDYPDVYRLSGFVMVIVFYITFPNIVMEVKLLWPQLFLERVVWSKKRHTLTHSLLWQ